MTGMKFAIDNQTANDLELFDHGKKSFSVFSIFNKTRWVGGERKLECMFQQPLTDMEALRERVLALKYFEQLVDFIDFSREELNFIEIYLSNTDIPRSFGYPILIKRALFNFFKSSNEYYVCRRGVASLAKLLIKLNCLSEKVLQQDAPPGVCRYWERIRSLIHESCLKSVLSAGHYGIFTAGRLDFYFRTKERENIREILDIMYEIDALRSVAAIGVEKGFSYPVFSEAERVIKIKSLCHPLLKNPVRNDVEMSEGQNICFLTGSNMAGKSTYMKALGIAVYLSHIGFPVPAAYLEISIFNGLFTTINLSDNISLGYSHYFNEVLRVKHVAQEIVRLKNVVVVFDELFRGTNIKDAYDASLAVISAFAGLNQSVFVVSSHILEIAKQLERYSTVYFRFFEIRMNKDVPYYTYKLLPGVSNERIGMYILNQEKVLETIRSAGK